MESGDECSSDGEMPENDEEEEYEEVEDSGDIDNVGRKRRGTNIGRAASRAADEARAQEEKGVEKELEHQYSKGQPIYKEGWIKKKGGGSRKKGRHNWKNRWFALRGLDLAYYKSEATAKKDKAKGLIPLVVYATSILKCIRACGCVHGCVCAHVPIVCVSQCCAWHAHTLLQVLLLSLCEANIFHAALRHELGWFDSATPH